MTMGGRGKSQSEIAISEDEKNAGKPEISA
jgi:hypothetical protein